MKKRLISLILVFCMLFSMVPASAIAVGAEDEAAKEPLINPFTDVKEDAWYYDSVQYVRVNGIFNGTTAETFDPNGTMTRAMFVTVLGRMAGVVAEDYKGESIFTDVSADAYYAPYVAWAAKHGITTGTSENTFSPSDLITRQQMATFFVRYFDTFGIELEVEEEVTSVPVDIDSAAPYAREAISKLWKTGLLNGDGVSFNPSGYASRAQTATLCARADESVEVWYREPGVESERVRIDPATGLPFEKEEEAPVIPSFNVVYTDGVEDEEVFADQSFRKVIGVTTPAFEGTPTREGYTFAGWSPEVAERVTGNITYTANWTINQYTISFENTGDSTIVPITQDYATAVNAPSNPVKTGYTFAGWDKEIPTTIPAENVTVTAQWTINQYSISFENTGDNAVDPITQDYGTEVTAPSDPVKTGYTFNGWNKDIPTTMPAEDVCIEAKWAPNTYAITFDAKGGTLNDDAESSVDVIYDTAYQLPTASKEGWTFSGWYLDDGVTQISTGDTVKITSATTLTAKWEVGEGYSITYNLDGGYLSTSNPAGFNVATETFTLNNPTKEGYTFVGWSGSGLTGDNNMTVTIPEGSTRDRSYTAHWVINQYTITFENTGDSTVAPITQDYATAVAAPSNPTKTGYTFAGWDVDIPATMPADDITITAKWTINQYSISFENTGDSTINPIIQDYGTEVTAPFDPVKTGYTFAGWDKEIPTTIPAENVTITAKWTINQYTISFITGEGATQIAPITQDYGTAVTAPADPTLKGHIFAGWDKAFPATMPADNLALTAQWNPIIYSVEFYDGDRLIDTLYAGEDYPLGAVPEVAKSSKANAILLGYFQDAQFTQPFYADNPVTEDMKVYAQYEEMGSPETLNFTSYAQIDQEPDISFEIVGSGDPSEAVTLEVKDGSDPVELIFEESENGYIVKAKDGFNRGCSYQLHLADGWTFYGKPDTIRTASFSIFMEEVYNLQMNDSIVYIQDTDDMDYTIGGQIYEVLTSSLMTADSGTFTYTGTDVEEGDIICVYVGTHPELRNKNGDGSDTLDPAVYVKVSDITGSDITFNSLSAEDQLELYEIPDNFPIIVSALPTGETGTVNISALDEEVYVMMMGDGYTLATAKKTIAVGDFISLYVSQKSIKAESDIYFGEITAYDSATGEITYKRTTSQAIQDSMNLYSNINLEGDDFLTEEDKNEIEMTTLAQLEDSSFAEDAAYLLADMITKTDGFRNDESIRNFLVTDTDGTPLSDEQLELLGLGSSFELTDAVKLTVELITGGSQLHFRGGTQLAVGIEAEFEVELENEDKIVIQISATFVQEVSIDPRVKGSMVTKKVLGFIPIPVGVRVTSTIDIRNFTAFSFEAVIYTVAAEDEKDWTEFKKLANSALKDLGIKIPTELVEGAKTVKDVVDKIHELEDMAAKAKDAGEQYMGYLEDAESLWNALDVSNGFDRASWEATTEALGEANITSELLDMMNMTTETGLETTYYDSLEALLDRYCEMLEQESDWIELVRQKIFQVEACFYGVCIGIKTDFVIRTDLSLAIGSNLEYQVGKRYEFWFEIGLFSPSAGSSTMDLIDEKFGFQFYVMGRMGLKAGIAATLYVGIGSGGDLASVGITTELGPYIKIYGFFVYEYTKYRTANTNNWVSNERMAGAMYLEFGLYFILSFEAQALGLFEYSHDFLDEEIPLLTAGNTRYFYDLAYKPAEEEMVLVKDVDGNSTTGITMELPEYMLNLTFMDLMYGIKGFEAKDLKDYNFTVSNPNFSINKNTGVISVNVPEGVGYIECDLTITYKRGKLAFTDYDMSTTVPLVWTNMSTEELSEFYTATVRVGNDTDGYETVWSQRLLKNKQYDLPTAEDIYKAMSWNDHKYEIGSGYGGIATEDLTLVEDKQYDFNIAYKTYSVTVTGVQNADGSTEDRTYYAKFGEEFDFSDLKNTGTVDYANGVFTSFAGLSVEDGIDLSRAVNTKLADALTAGIAVSAKYVDNGITATFVFNGLDKPDVVMKLRRGDTPDISGITKAVTDAKLSVTDISPAVGMMTSSTTYQVACHRTTNDDATLSFIENGGPEVEDITLPWDSIIQLPTPEREGYTFDGWYSDAELTTPFTETKLPEGGATVYAKWTANEYTVTFDINGGNGTNSTKTVTYDQPYGTLPTPSRTNYGFIGWFTAASGGTQISAEDTYKLTDGQTLYAQWRELKNIPTSVFDFGSQEVFNYAKNTTRSATYTYKPESGAMYDQGDFTVEYICQGYESEGYFETVSKAGTYNVRITREADEYYNRFQYTYTGALTINKVTRKLDGITVKQNAQGLTYFKLQLTGTIDDMDPNAKIRYVVNGTTGSPTALSAESIFDNLTPGTNYTVTVKVSDDRNYNYTDYSTSFSTKSVGSSKYWTASGNYDTSWYSSSKSEFTITTAKQLAGLAYLANKSTAFSNQTIKLGANIDMSAYRWMPIGIVENHLGALGGFMGTFDGQGYTISGLYFNDDSESDVGLFACAARSAIIKNVVVDDSYFNGFDCVGGIAGSMECRILNCVSYASVNSIGDGVGGIAGVASQSGAIVNCVNYGNVTALGHKSTGLGSTSVYGGQGVGGIVGATNYNIEILNNVNFGKVSGNYEVGGIVGNFSAAVHNNYNMGAVTAIKNSGAGAIAGSYAKSTNTYMYKPCIQYNYYLKGTASSAYPGITDGNGAGNSLSGILDKVYASSFTGTSSTMASSAGTYAGYTLISALKAWVSSNASSYSYYTPATWVANGPNGYPIPSGSYISSLRK